MNAQEPLPGNPNDKPNRFIAAIGLTGLILFGVLLPLLLLEVVLQVRAARSDKHGVAYDVLFFYPDSVTGWKLVPDFQFTWTGRDCAEYATQVTTNSYGFRDVEWALDKPDDTLRIALLGDSFIEALQVPLEQTAAKQLQKRLTEELKIPGIRNVEVMDFGVSNFGVGQYLLTYDEYVSQFQPDYVILLTSYLHMARTLQANIASGLDPAYALNVRPSYELDETGGLRYLPAKDFDEFVNRLQYLLDTQYGENRSIEIPAESKGFRLLAPDWITTQWEKLTHPVKKPAWPQYPYAKSPAEPDSVGVLNAAILTELNAHVQANGGHLAIVDASEYFDIWWNANFDLATYTRNLSEQINAGYIHASPALYAANKKSSIHWPCDGHWSPEGNRVFAGILFDWFTQELNKPQD